MKIEKSREQQWGLLDRLSTLYLTCSSTTQPKAYGKLDALLLGGRRWVWRVAFLIYLNAADNRSDGRNSASFASTVSWPALCELRGAFAYGRLSLGVCFTSSERLFSKWWATVTLIYPNPACPTLNGWRTNSRRSAGRHASVGLQREGSGRHLSHQMQPANEKHPNNGILHSDHRSGCILQIFGHYTENKSAHSDGLGACQIPPKTPSVIWNVAKFGCMEAVFRGMPCDVPHSAPLCRRCGRRCRHRPVS